MADQQQPETIRDVIRASREAAEARVQADAAAQAEAEAPWRCNRSRGPSYVPPLYRQ